jgi:hypothetical protein
MTTTEFEALQKKKRSPRAARRRGQELIEFTFIMLPMFAMLFVYLDICYWIWVKATLQQAVRLGARYGVTNQAAGPGENPCITPRIKSRVVWASGGLLRGAHAADQVEVKYLEPPDAANPDIVDVSTASDGNRGGNIVEVSVAYSSLPLLPVIVDWGKAPDKRPLTFTVVSADRIEPGGDPPCNLTE